MARLPITTTRITEAIDPAVVGAKLSAGRRHRTCSQRKAFSLVEVLVVIGIVGTLVGLLLPAVQRTREASRRTSCTNNMHQVAVAVSTYEAGHNSFPPGCDLMPRAASLPNGTEFSWTSFILPSLGHSELASRIDFGRRWDAPGGNDTVSDCYLPEYVCPSGIVASVGKSDYGGIAGSWIDDPDVPFHGVEGLSNGMLFPIRDGCRPVRTAGVTDGLSKTLLAAETVDSGDAAESVAEASATGRWARLNVFAQATPFINMRASSIHSNHASGAVAAFADGHVTFLDENMDPTVLSAICTRNGAEAKASQ